MATEKQIARIRHETARAMTCKSCEGRMLIVESGIVCEHGCGRIMPYPKFIGTDAVFHQAWPDRVIEHAATFAQRLKMIEGAM